MERLVPPWTRVREPELTGAEDPFPNCGVQCAHCGHELAGATGGRCGNCEAPIRADELRPPGEWFRLRSEWLGGMPEAQIAALLREELIPFVMRVGRTTEEIVMGAAFAETPILIPSDYYFDMRALIRDVQRDVARRRELAQHERPCPHCGEENPGSFDHCWNCEKPLNENESGAA